MNINKRLLKITDLEIDLNHNSINKYIIKNQEFIYYLLAYKIWGILIENY